VEPEFKDEAGQCNLKYKEKALSATTIVRCFISSSWSWPNTMCFCAIKCSNIDTKSSEKVVVSCGCCPKGLFESKLLLPTEEAHLTWSQRSGDSRENCIPDQPVFIDPRRFLRLLRDTLLVQTGPQGITDTFT